ncbi:MAG: hypothetical protein K2I11_03265, partial [Bacteroides sp.]|nr:hypothetical protein [Bacteroides sp.]
KVIQFPFFEGLSGVKRSYSGVIGSYFCEELCHWLLDFDDVLSVCYSNLSEYNFFFTEKQLFLCLQVSGLLIDGPWAVCNQLIGCL